MPVFSIIVPVYNSEKYIGWCVESLRAQTLKDIEIILVDDGSTDSSGRLLDSFALEDKRIKVIHKKNAGVAAARNDGLKAARGEYVLFCDSDDMMEYDGCEALYKKALDKDADVIVGDVYRILGGEKVYARFWGHPFTITDRNMLDTLIRTDFSKKYCHDIPKGGPAFGYGGPWNKAVKRSFLESTGICFDESLKGIFDDILYTAYLYAEAKKVSYITSPVYDYRILEGSVTHSFKENMPQINRAIFSSWDKFLEKYGKDGRFSGAYDALIIRRLKGLLGTYFFNPENPKSLKDQKKELKELMKAEPYKSAVKNVDPKKLINNYDLAVYTAAKLNSPALLKTIYSLYLRLKDQTR